MTPASVRHIGSYLRCLLRARRGQVVAGSTRIARALRRLGAAPRDVAHLATVVALRTTLATQHIGCRGALATDMTDPAAVVAAAGISTCTSRVLGARTRHVSNFSAPVALLAALRSLRDLRGAVARQVLRTVAPEARLRKGLLGALGGDVTLLIAVVAAVTFCSCQRPTKSGCRPSGTKQCCVQLGSGSARTSSTATS